MHVKFGDTVKVISGRDKGKVGEVTKIFTHNSTIVIKDVNLKTKHMKSREEGEPGQIVKIEAPVRKSFKDPFEIYSWTMKMVCPAC
ncbi:unnamed protein product [Eruca vesicaria subsp. sativa]|uniref:KOW domain-containing protein n=1 Tax=Eruca vesicaria subsp. sativa TaxID=29727 RepID=A0ABC8K1Y9_ERUVS|nr:unnamed protein product [Eruca vesicaria subsp. sativa]